MLFDKHLSSVVKKGEIYRPTTKFCYQFSQNYGQKQCMKHGAINPTLLVEMLSLKFGLLKVC